MSIKNLIERSERITPDQKIIIRHYKNTILRFSREFSKKRLPMVALGIITAFSIIALLAPYIAPFEPTEYLFIDSSPAKLEEPNANFVMGTNHLSQDVFSQWLYGTRISLLVGIVSGFAVVFMGTLVGMVAGYYRGNVDMVLMRFVDTLFGLPTMPLVLIAALFLGPSIWNIIIIMALVMWRNMARVIRAETLSVTGQSYIKSARALGASDTRIMVTHVLPNLSPLIIIEGTIAAGLAITLEAGMSFLGFGAQNVVSWGAMLELAFQSGAIRFAWWWVIPPGASITLMVVSLFFMSRGVEDVTNPVTR